MTPSQEPPAATPALQRLRTKAKNEIGERDDLIPKKIAEVREIINADRTVNAPPKSYDQFLLRCLRARKYDVERAAKTYKKLCLVHQNCKEITDYLLPSTHNGLLKKKFVSLLSPRDSSGRQILFIQPINWNASKYTLDEALAGLFMTVDEAASTIDTQLNGLVVLVDFKGFGFGHARQVSPSRVQCVVNILQDSYPARFKELHFFNHPTLFNMIFAVAKPFLKEKMRKRIFFHGHDISSVHKSISPSILPEHIGGKLKDNECYDEQALSRLLKKDEYFTGIKDHFVIIRD